MGISDKDVKVLWNVLFYTSLIFMIFFLFYGFKSVNGELCSSSSFTNNPSITNDLVITNDNNYTIFPEYANKQTLNSEEYQFCLEVTTNSSVYVRTTLNNDLELINNVTQGFTCYQEKTSYNGSITFSCLDCDNNNAASVTRTNTKVTTKTNSVYSKEYDLYAKTVFRKNCKSFFKNLMNYYFVIIGLFIFIFLLKRAVNWFGRWVSNIG